MTGQVAHSVGDASQPIPSSQLALWMSQGRVRPNTPELPSGAALHGFRVCPLGRGVSGHPWAQESLPTRPSLLCTHVLSPLPPWSLSAHLSCSTVTALVLTLLSSPLLSDPSRAAWAPPVCPFTRAPFLSPSRHTHTCTHALRPLHGFLLLLGWNSPWHRLQSGGRWPCPSLWLILEPGPAALCTPDTRLPSLF